jgi:hypothetical protein
MSRPIPSEDKFSLQRSMSVASLKACAASSQFARPFFASPICPPNSRRRAWSIACYDRTWNCKTTHRAKNSRGPVPPSSSVEELSEHLICSPTVRRKCSPILATIRQRNSAPDRLILVRGPLRQCKIGAQTNLRLARVRLLTTFVLPMTRKKLRRAADTLSSVNSPKKVRAKNRWTVRIRR